MDEEAPKTQQAPQQLVTERDIKDMFKTINNLQKECVSKSVSLTLDVLYEHVKTRLPDKSFLEEIVKKLDQLNKICYDAISLAIIPL